MTFNGFSYSVATDATDNMSQQDSDVLFSDQGVSIPFVETSLSDLDRSGLHLRLISAAQSAKRLVRDAMYVAGLLPRR